MKLKNVSARAYGVNGKVISPLDIFEVTDSLTLKSIQMHINAGDFQEVEEPRKAGRPAKQEAE